MIKRGKVLKVFKGKSLVKFDGMEEVVIKKELKLGAEVKYDVDILKVEGRKKDIVLAVRRIGKNELIRKENRSVNENENVNIKREVLTGTLCSKSKKKVKAAEPEVLWDSSRIRKYFGFCDLYKIPGSIVSWKYGVVPREVSVFNYDQFETGNEKHWIEVLEEAKRKYEIKKLFMWFDPGRSMSTTILRAMEKVFEVSGGTKHLYNLVRYLEKKEEGLFENDNGDVSYLINSLVPVRSRVIFINSGDMKNVFYLSNYKRCKCIVYDKRKWAKVVQKAVVERQRLPKRLPENLEELKKNDNLTVKAAAILYERAYNKFDMNKFRRLCEKLLATGKYKRVEIRHVRPKITKNDIVIIRENDEIVWDELLREVGKRVPSAVYIVLENKLHKLNSFLKLTGKYFSDRSVMTLKGNVLFRCA